ncbi:uncharacterized protein LOC143054404 [Mytilus galloprovincialis]|uniref:uncharacterized protein LOC143054404 n=1 Tax=Mytilus galloprovincialis TaxID=29158 RepID=UPI003F7C2997
MPPKRGKSRQSDQPTHKKQKTNIDYTKLAAEILRLQSDKTNASNQPTTSSGVNIEADIHVDTDVSQNQLHGTIQIPTSTQNVNIDPVSCTVSAPNPTSAASEESTTQIHVNPTCTVAPDDTTTSVLNPSCSTSKEFDIQTVVETLFSGEPPVNTHNSSENSLKIQVSDGIPLGATVSQKIKEKIWSDEFIDMNSLTSSYVEDPFSLFVSNRKFSLYNNSRSNKPPLSIEQWTSAYLVFSDIYIEKCPEEARHLLKYGHNIREMYDLYGDEPWRIYDEKFRRLRETIKLPWGKLIDELYTKSANSSNTQNKNFRAQPARQNKSFQNQGNTQYYNKNMPSNNIKTCILFNRGQTCNKPCSYKHVCHFCKGAHAIFQCSEYKPQQNAQQNKQVPNQKQNTNAGKR